VITDAAGKTVTKTYTVPADEVSEKLNAKMKPLVDMIGQAIFFDPFAALGIYDPIIKDDLGNIVYHPNGSPKKNSFPFIVLWLVVGAIFFTIYIIFFTKNN
jgi:AGCS family alanine or glycine:cation symporter